VLYQEGRLNFDEAMGLKKVSYFRRTLLRRIEV